MVSSQESRLQGLVAALPVVYEGILVYVSLAESRVSVGAESVGGYLRQTKKTRETKTGTHTKGKRSARYACS